LIICGDALTELKKLDSGIAQTCITSPPYWGLRDYGVAGQLGLESTPEEYTARLMEVFAEVKRVLRDDGILWLVLGDSYAAKNGSGGVTPENKQFTNAGSLAQAVRKPSHGLKHKDLVGIPWRVAFALQADGWYLRSDIIWSKPNPMPESVTDRPTKAHEYVFLLAKRQGYFYDGDAIAEDAICGDHARFTATPVRAPGQKEQTGIRGMGLSLGARARESAPRGSFNGKCGDMAFRAIRDTRNKRTVWTVATKPYPEAHFAVYPPALIEPCVLAGSAEGDVVIDPFAGSGTTGEVALKHRRKFIGIELNPEDVKLAEKRLREVQIALPLGGGK
jgi:DNA modification methylase